MPYRILGKVKPVGRFLDVLVHVNVKPTATSLSSHDFVQLVDRALIGINKGVNEAYCSCELIGDSDTQDTNEDWFASKGLLEFLGIPEKVLGEDSVQLGKTIYPDFWHRVEPWQGLAAIYFGKQPEDVTTKERLVMFLLGKLI